MSSTFTWIKQAKKANMLSLFTQAIYSIQRINMPRIKKSRGAPMGSVNNPKGANQWQDVRSEKPIAVRLLKEQDEAIRAKAAAEGKTLTQIMDEAIALYLTNNSKQPIVTISSSQQERGEQKQKLMKLLKQQKELLKLLEATVE